MKIKHKAPLLLLSATLITAGITAYNNYQTNVHLIESAKMTELKMVATQIQNDLIDEGNSAASKVALVIERPDVKAAFRAQDRAKLTDIMLSNFMTLKNKYGVREAQFNLPPAQVFLRLHNLPLFGDDNSRFREMILMAVKNKKGYQGLEIGRSGINIRAIEPVVDDKGLIGTFEIGMSLGTILDDIKKNTEFDAAIFINDALITKIATSRPRAGQERIFGDLQGIGATDWSKILPFMTADSLNKVNDITLVTKNINGTDYGMVFMPLLDFKNTEIGTIVAVSDYSHYQAELRASLYESISFALLQVIILMGVMLITFRVMLLKPIRYINGVVHDWRNGQGDKNMGHLSQLKDEIGELCVNLEALHKKNDTK